MHNSDASRREKAKLYLAVIARSEATKQSILSFCGKTDCFLFAARRIASRSLSSGAHSRDPLARNDG
jgi:hypothetical protein